MSFIEDIAVPEMNKMVKADAKAKPIFEFLVWLEAEKKVVLPAEHSDLLYEYFGVDKEKAAREMAQLKDAAKEQREKLHKEMMAKIRATSADELTTSDANDLLGSMFGMDEKQTQEAIQSLPEDHRKKMKDLVSETSSLLGELMEQANNEEGEDE